MENQFCTEHHAKNRSMEYYSIKYITIKMSRYQITHILEEKKREWDFSDKSH
jgi:hypothetical protein